MNFNEKNLQKSILSCKNELENLDILLFNDLSDKNIALIIIDVINGFINDGALADRSISDIIPNITKLMKTCKKNGIPIIAFADCHSEDSAEFFAFPKHCIRGTYESDIAEDIKKTGGYFLIEKNSTNGFSTSEFNQFLNKNPQITNFIITGDCTDICVLQFTLSLKAYFNQNNVKSNLYIPANCVQTYDSPEHNKDFYNLISLILAKNAGINIVSEVI